VTGRTNYQQAAQGLFALPVNDTNIFEVSIKVPLDETSNHIVSFGIEWDVIMSESNV
jgi:hypothetical protein